jgi:hypothetical protein
MEGSVEVCWVPSRVFIELLFNPSQTNTLFSATCLQRNDVQQTYDTENNFKSDQPILQSKTKSDLCLRTKRECVGFIKYKQNKRYKQPVYQKTMDCNFLKPTIKRPQEHNSIQF